jgi:hypothetical protein
MTISITETDGTKRTMSGAIEAIHINVEDRTVSMKVIGIRDNFQFTIKDVATITERTI